MGEAVDAGDEWIDRWLAGWLAGWIRGQRAMSEGCMERANDKARSREVRVLKPACRRQEDPDELTDTT